jgi:hypothetical protein
MPEGECGTVAQLPVSPRLQRSQVPHQAILSSDCTLSLCAKGGSQSLSGPFRPRRRIASACLARKGGARGTQPSAAALALRDALTQQKRETGAAPYAGFAGGSPPGGLDGRISSRRGDRGKADGQENERDSPAPIGPALVGKGQIENDRQEQHDHDARRPRTLACTDDSAEGCAASASEAFPRANRAPETARVPR